MPPPTRSSSDVSYKLVSRAGRDAPLSAVSDMKGALGFVGVFLSFLLDTTYGESVLPFKCGDNHCKMYCQFCHEFYGTPSMDCLSTILNLQCFNDFKKSMAHLNSADHCVWRNVNGFYSNLSDCTENISDCLQIPWPNPLVERRFVEIHEEFFMDCPSEELSDPPTAIILALVITPICLIPIMVSLVVLKTKNGDGSS